MAPTLLRVGLVLGSVGVALADGPPEWLQGPDQSMLGLDGIVCATAIYDDGTGHNPMDGVSVV